jgi:hypothetical protein
MAYASLKFVKNTQLKYIFHPSSTKKISKFFSSVNSENISQNFLHIKEVKKKCGGWEEKLSKNSLVFLGQPIGLGHLFFKGQPIKFYGKNKF